MLFLEIPPWETLSPRAYFGEAAMGVCRGFGVNVCLGFMLAFLIYALGSPLSWPCCSLPCYCSLPCSSCCCSASSCSLPWCPCVLPGYFLSRFVAPRPTTLASAALFGLLSSAICAPHPTLILITMILPLLYSQFWHNVRSSTRRFDSLEAEGPNPNLLIAGICLLEPPFWLLLLRDRDACGHRQVLKEVRLLTRFLSMLWARFQ
jgi:hypothetical protein